MELLEGRQLLAADSSLHNRLIPEDVNKDFNVSPLDAMLVINALHRRATGSGEGEASTNKFLTDVSGDGIVSPLDAMLVINQLNAEGEDDKLVSYTLQITNLSGTPITTIPVGSEFLVKVFAQDLRGATATGVGSAGFDIDLVGSETETNLVRFPTLGPGILASPGQFFSGADLGVVGSDQEIDELSVIMGFTPPADLDPPQNPSDAYPVISARFTALKSGEISFGLNAAETSQAQTILHGDETDIPTSVIMYQGVSASTRLVIQADPTAPVAVNDTTSTPEDISLVLAGTGSTVSPPLIQNDTVTAGRTLTVTSVNAISGITQGTVSGLTYTPPANFFGQDRVAYTVTDTNGLTSTATVTINVSPVNDTPVAAPDAASGFSNEPVTIAISTLLTNDSPGPGESRPGVPDPGLSISSVATTSGSVAIVGANIVYTPPTDFIGDRTFTYTLVDDGTPPQTAVGTVTVTLDPREVPFARRDTASTTEISAGELQTGVSIPVLANDLVNEGATKVLVRFDALSARGGTITANADGTLQYVPKFEFNGVDTFTYTLSDTLEPGSESVATVTVNVADANDAPTAANDNATGTEDIPVTIAISTLLANDSPGLGETAADTSTPQTLTLSIPNGSSTQGTAVVSGANVVFTPNANLNGNVTFTYLVTDSGTPALTATATVTVNLAAVNDSPVAGADRVSTNEDTPLVITNLQTLLSNDSAGPSDEPQGLTLVSVSKPTATLGSVAFDAVAGTITYTPSQNFNGDETFTYVVRDSEGATGTGTVTVTVNPVNDAPVVGADSVVAFKGVPLQIPVADLLANDAAGPANANESGQTLRITAVTSGPNGTVTLNQSTGIITFTPAANYSGPASFQYTVQDSGPTALPNVPHVNSQTGTVSVTVRDFVPTEIKGTVWVDETNDGIINSAERKLGGVEVTLTGNALGVPIAAQTYITLADGSYRFSNLAPGEYVVTYNRPTYMVDGGDVAGALGDADSLANQFTVNVAQPGGADASGYKLRHRWKWSQRSQEISIYWLRVTSTATQP